MRDALAERLLAQVMDWTPEDVARERPDLQALAIYKYDEYQRFFPGMRFVESLASWLSQFEQLDERRKAYAFVKKRMLFCSAAELNHLVSIAYHDHVRPWLLKRVARDEGIDGHLVGRVAVHPQFRVRQRQCLFLGLSDGARTDVFRRANSTELSHEQILQTYEVSAPRVEELLSKLSDGIAAILGATPPVEETKFRTVVLLDDFSGSGLSYVRRGEGNSLKGKIGEFHCDLMRADGYMHQLVDVAHLEVIVVLYVATEQARTHLESFAGEMWSERGAECSIMVLSPLTGVRPIARDDDDEMVAIIEKYYDPSIEDQHTKVGGTDLKYGFSGCGLPLVLGHNTPNNSLALLWADTGQMRGLFPRVSRHRRDA